MPQDITFMYGEDGTRYRVTVAPGGAGVNLTEAPGTPEVTVNTDRSTITLQKTVNLAATHTELMPLAGVAGYSEEPALSLCNEVVQELLGGGYPWKFNRAEMAPIFTQKGKQDYLFAGAFAFTMDGKACGIGLASDASIVKSGGVVTVTTLEDHAFEVGDEVFLWGISDDTYNSTFTQTPNGCSWSGSITVAAVPAPRSFQYTVEVGPEELPTGAPGIYDFGELESATMVAANDTSSPQRIWNPTAVRTLKKSSDAGVPDKVAIVEEGNGVLKVRLHGIPQSTTYQLSLVYQKKAPLKTTLNNTWAPFPDEYAFVFQQAFLAKAYRYVNSRRAEVEYQKLGQAIARAIGKDDSESSDEQFAPQTPLMDWGY